MKLILVTVCFIAAAFAAPNLRSAEDLAAMRALPALEHEEVHDEFGQYALRYVTAEGIVVSERGRLVPNIEGDGYVLITEGEISYIGDDGKVYVTKFSAGLEGTNVEGNHLPVAPKPVEPEVVAVPEVPNSDPEVTVIPERVPTILTFIE